MLPAGFDPLRAATAPRREALLAVMAASLELREARGFAAAADSPAMAQIEAGRRYVNESGVSSDPVIDALQTSVMLLVAAEDHIAAMCRLTAIPEPVVWADVVLARAGLEACGRAAWLAEAGITTEQRVGRYLNLRLLSLAAQARLPGAPAADLQAAQAKRAALLAAADTMGLVRLQSKKGRPPQMIEPVPPTTKMLRSLFDRKGNDDLGPLLWGVQSAIAHSTLYGLLLAVDDELSEELPDLTGLNVRAALVMSSDRVKTTQAACSVAYAHAVTDVYQLHGWTSPAWQGAVMAAVKASRSERSSASPQHVE